MVCLYMQRDNRQTARLKTLFTHRCTYTWHISRTRCLHLLRPLSGDEAADVVGVCQHQQALAPASRGGPALDRHSGGATCLTLLV